MTTGRWREIDHLVFAAPTLAQGIEYIADLTGVTPRPGGKHAGMGTHNALVKLGERLYLEIIAIDPDAPKPARPRWFDLDDGNLMADLFDRPRTHPLGRAHARPRLRRQAGGLRHRPRSCRSRAATIAGESRSPMTAGGPAAACCRRCIAVGVRRIPRIALPDCRPVARAARRVAPRPGDGAALAGAARAERRHARHVRSRRAACRDAADAARTGRAVMPAPIKSLEAFAVSLPRDVPYLGPLGAGESVNAKGYIVRRGQPHDLPVERHVGAREGHRGRRHRRLGRDVRHRRAAGRARDPARSAVPVRRGTRRARRGSDLRRALRPAARARRFGRVLRRRAGCDRHRAVGCRRSTGRRAALRSARRCAHAFDPGVRVRPSEGDACRARRAGARRSRRAASEASSTQASCRTKASSRRCMRCAMRCPMPTSWSTCTGATTSTRR